MIEHDLVDEYRLMIEPILLGGGKRAFSDDGQGRPLELVSTSTAATGVLICTYRPQRSVTRRRIPRGGSSPPLAPTEA